MNDLIWRKNTFTADTMCMHQYSICINKQIFCYCAICIFHSTLVSKWEKMLWKINQRLWICFYFIPLFDHRIRVAAIIASKKYFFDFRLSRQYKELHTLFMDFLDAFFSVHCTRLVALLTIYLLAAYILGNFQLLYWPRPLAVLYPRARLRRGWRTPGRRRREARLMLR